MHTYSGVDGEIIPATRGGQLKQGARELVCVHVGAPGVSRHVP